MASTSSAIGARTILAWLCVVCCAVAGRCKLAPGLKAPGFKNVNIMKDRKRNLLQLVLSLHPYTAGTVVSQCEIKEGVDIPGCDIVQVTKAAQDDITLTPC